MVKTTRQVTLMLLAAGLLAVGCSSGDDDDDVASVNGDDETSESDSSDREQAEQGLLDWVDCMQAEGVEVSDPVRDDNGNLVINSGPLQINTGGPGSGGPSSNDAPPDEGDEPRVDVEEMQAAQETCGNPPAVPGEMLDEADEEEMQAQALEFSKCMRENGIADFPDPDFSQNGPGGAPQTNSGGPGDDSDDGGTAGGDGEGPQARIMGPWGEIDLSDPEMKAAFDACEPLMAPPDGAGTDEGQDADT